jgi:hypothetical protein
MANPSWQAGTAKTIITPQHPMWLSGYAARNKPASGKIHDLWCKALALQDGRGQRCVLVTLDLVGIDRTLMRSVQRRVLNDSQLPAEAIRLACSHTHSGPVIRGNLAPMYQLDAEQSRFVDEYADWLEDQIVHTIGAALKQFAPAQLRYGSGQASFAVNRRNNKEPEVPGLKTSGQLRGPVDHDVPVLQVLDAANKQIALVFGYACHATVLDGYRWCGDYPGFAQLAIEKQFPGTTAFFWAGCGGDQNPLPRRKLELAEEYGRQLADAVAEVLKGQLQPIAGRLSMKYDEMPLPFAPLPSRQNLLHQLEDQNKYVVLRARYLLKELEQGKELSPYYPYPIQIWHLGDGPIWIGLGGEVVVDYALRLKKEIEHKLVWVNGYCNDVMAYIPSRRVLKEGGYEGGGAMVYYGLPTIWGETVEETIVNAVKRQ